MARGASASRYDAVTVTLHWLTALLVLVLFGTALAWDNTPRDWGLHRLESLHVSLGIGLAAVIVLRLLWRLTAGRHLAEIDGRPILNFLARLVHLALYVLLFVQVGLGFAMQGFGGHDLSFFGIIDIPLPLGRDRELGHELQELHEIVAWTIVILAFAHAIAALGHRYLLKDGVLRRMVPWSRPAET